MGNAIVGLLGPNGTSQPGNLAAGIDGMGNVFIAEYDPAQKLQQPNVVPVGVLNDYTGNSPVTLTINIYPNGIVITAGTTTFKEFHFAQNLNNFSMQTAFPNGAVPASLLRVSPRRRAARRASSRSL